jgi:2-oxoglutarate dehydrogenase E2 component (dihydrolipoamide succinyltransferase)
MNEEIKITLPKLGESIVSATIVQWFKKIGDRVNLDEPLLEVSTDKINSEIPSPVSGVLKMIHAHPDEELQVGDLLATVMVGEGGVHSASPRQEKQIQGETAVETSSMQDFFSPALLRLAKEKGVSLEELERLAGSGGGGRVTKKDLEEHLKNYAHPVKPLKAVVSCPHQGEGIERVKMSGMRKAIADNMVRSFYEAPHATLISEIDVTAVIKLIQKEREKFFEKHGVKLTISSFVAHAISRALQEYPLINSSLEKDTIVVKRFVNLGVAVNVDQGLFVPVIKHCDRMGIISVAKAIAELSVKAREGKLTPSDVSEGTISMTNFGMTGVLIGIPIIRYPEVAIIGVGAIHKKVIVLEEDLLAIRSMMHLCLTFDHRVLDGMYGCGFLASLKKHLEENLKID